jgi:translation initiation factor 3 subunit I
LSFGDKLIFCLHDVEKRSYIRIFKMEDILTNNTEGTVAGKGVKEIHTLEGSKDYQYTKAVWGPRNESLLIATNTGKVLYYDIESASIISEEPVHSNEIFCITLTHDYTMLYTSSRDGTCKLLNPETLNVIRTFNYGKPCRTASVSPLFESLDYQKFHVLMAGGQDAKDVTTTGAELGGFEMKLFNVIFNEKLSEVHGHFGPVHTTSFSPDGFSFASGAEDGYVHYHRFPPEYFTKKFE